MLLKFACNRYTHVRHVYWNANVNASKDYKEKSTLKREKKVEANEEEE